MSKITIGEKTYIGNSIIVNNGKIFVDGKRVDTDDQPRIEIKVEGNVEFVQVDYCEKIGVNGNVHSINTSSGNVECEDVLNSVRTQSGDITCNDVSGDVNSQSGDIDCDNIDGDVTTVSGDVEAKTIGGNVKTVSGDISH